MPCAFTTKRFAASHAVPAGVGACLASLLAAGCAFHYQGPTPDPTEWRVVERPTGRGSLELADVRFTPTGPRSALLSGVVKHAEAEIHAFESRTEPHIREHTFLFFTQERLASKEVARNHRRELRDFPVETIVIDNPFGPGARAKVDASGDFSVELTFDPPHVTLPPNEEQAALSLFEYVSPPAQVSALPAGVRSDRFQPAVVRLPIWRYELDEDKAVAFAKKQTTRVEIRVADMLSRVGTPARVRVRCLEAPTRSEMQQRLARAYHSEQAARAMMRHVPEYLGAGQSAAASEGVLAFQAAVGAAYRLETRHPDYIHFERVIVPKTSPIVRKVVLLPEKGSKIRVERVDDSLGGALAPDRP